MSDGDVEIRGCDILEKIGVGPRSGIYKVRRRKDAQVIAVKYVMRYAQQDRKYLRHLSNEYSVLSSLQGGKATGSPHPNIVLPYGYKTLWSLTGVRAAYMTMEYVPGFNLGQKSDYGLKEIVDFFVQVADALRFVHRMGYLHGDVKPDNVVVRPDGRVKLVDFGFSCPEHTRIQGIKGSRDYIAPEQMSGGVLTTLTDIYNFGASLYRVVTGHALPALVPSLGDDAIFISGERVKATPAHELRPDLPRLLSDLIMHCCQRRPYSRPGNMTDVLARLTRERSLM